MIRPLVAAALLVFGLGGCATVGEPIAHSMIERVGEQRDAIRRVDDSVHRAIIDRAIGDICNPRVSDLRRIADTAEKMAAWNTLCPPGQPMSAFGASP